METNHLASRSSRLLASLVDGFITFLIFAVIALITGILNFSTIYETKNDPKFELASFLVSITCTIIFTILIPTYIWNGQTIGKRWMSIAVVKENNGQVNLKTMIIRSIFSLLIKITLPIISTIIGILAFIDPLFIFRENRKTLHDLIAKTKVVDV